MRDYTNEGVEVRYPKDAIATKQAGDIMDRLVPEWAAGFLGKNRKYKAVGNDLGPRGVYPDINRKTGILKDRVWDGNGVVGEGTREVIQDLIGHLFLMLHMIDNEVESDIKWDVAATGPMLDHTNESDELLEGQGWALDRAADRLVVVAGMDRDEAKRYVSEAAAAYDIPTVEPVSPVVTAWQQGFTTGQSRAMRHMSDEPSLPLDADNPYKHVFDSLMNCSRCGYAHVGPGDRMYATPCLPSVSAHQGRKGHTEQFVQPGCALADHRAYAMPGDEPDCTCRQIIASRFGNRGAHQSRSEMTVSERMERDGGRH